MIDQNHIPRLFLVVLGGRSTSSHIELHDVRWVVGKNFEETFPQLRKEWFGNRDGLHIDSFMEIKYVDGYEILLRKRSFTNEIKPYKKQLSDKSITKKSLWFVNFGGYDPSQLLELHQFRLVVAKSAFEAKKIVKSKVLHSALQLHKDDCYSINAVQNYYVDLIPDPKDRSQELKPDWFGYLKIDKLI